MANEFKNVKMQNILAKIKTNPGMDTVNEIISCILSTRFIVPASWDKEPVLTNGQTVFEPNTKFQLMIIETKQHDCYFPMFTDLDEMKKWKEDSSVRSLILTFDQFMPFITMSKGDIKGIVIDPYGANFPVPSEFLIELQEKREVSLETKKIKKGEKVFLRDPQGDVEDLIMALKERADKEDSIVSIYLKEKMEDGVSHWFIIVESEVEDLSLFEKLGVQLRGVNQDKEIEFMFSNTKLAKEIMANSKPVYTKK